MDSAIDRRFKTQIHVPMPDEEQRLALLKHYLQGCHDMTEDEFVSLAAKPSAEMSCADIGKLYLKN